MRLSLAVFERPGDPEDALRAVLASIETAAAERPDLVLLAEGALTGLDLSGDPDTDLALGVEVPGPETGAIAAAARGARAHVGLGLLTRRGRTLFDTGLLFGPDGGILLRYDRVTAGWLPSRDADPARYGTGDRVGAADTALGRIAMLLCGDLFDDAVLEETRRLEPDLVLVPFARSFDRGGHDASRWESEEREAYLARAAGLGARTLLVNDLEAEDSCECPTFGGALVVDPAGRLEAVLPIGRPGVLTAVT
jgi:predicted amidohydrolase